MEKPLYSRVCNQSLFWRQAKITGSTQWKTSLFPEIKTSELKRVYYVTVLTRNSSNTVKAKINKQIKNWERTLSSWKNLVKKTRQYQIRSNEEKAWWLYERIEKESEEENVEEREKDIKKCFSSTPYSTWTTSFSHKRED